MIATVKKKGLHTVEQLDSVQVMNRNLSLYTDPQIHSTPFYSILPTVQSRVILTTSSESGDHRDSSFAPTRKKQLLLPVTKIYSKGSETREPHEQALATSIMRTTLYVRYQFVYSLGHVGSKAVNEPDTKSIQ